MGFLRNNDYDAWLNQGGTLLGPKTGGGGNNPVAPSGPTGPTGPQQSVAPTCASVQGQCPCYDGGCTDSNYMEYDANATCDDGTCSTLIIPGCTDATATNYNAQANVDDGTCTYPVVGCTNPAAQNYNPQAVQDDGSCQIVGCGDPNAANYNPNANYDCSGNPIGGVNTTTTGGGGTATPTKTGGVGTIGFDGCGYSNMGGCGNYNMASGCGTYYNQAGTGFVSPQSRMEEDRRKRIYLRKTRGTQLGSTARGARGQRQQFSNFNQQGFGGFNDKMWFND